MGVRTFYGGAVTTLPQGEWTPREELEYTSFLSGNEEVPFLSIRAVQVEDLGFYSAFNTKATTPYLARKPEKTRKVFIKIQRLVV